MVYSASAILSSSSVSDSADILDAPLILTAALDASRSFAAAEMIILPSPHTTRRLSTKSRAQVIMPHARRAHHRPIRRPISYIRLRSAPLRKSWCQSSKVPTELPPRLPIVSDSNTQSCSTSSNLFGSFGSFGSVPFSRSLCFVERAVLPQLKGSFWSPIEAETLDILSAVRPSFPINS